tara:strand:+ start:1004 stop:1198 length:195 start_codon:yes stop_codon:yes gene_type:complete
MVTTQLLDDDDRDALDQAIESVEALRPEIARAKSAGIDVTALEQRLNEQESQIRAIRTSFFPTG